MSLNSITPRGLRKYLFRKGTVLRVDEHEMTFLWAGKPFDKEPFLYEDIRSALSYDEKGALVIVVGRLRQYIREELDRLRLEGVRLYSPSLNRRT
jgi:hypothetical protein